MCGLCAVLGGEEHWTDAAANRAAFGRQAPPRPRLQERQHRVALANQVLRHYGLVLRDWGGNGYIVSTRTGASQMVDNLSRLWPAAERLAKRRCDPLDRALIAALAAA